MSKLERTDPWSIDAHEPAKNWTDSADCTRKEPLAVRLLQDIIAELEADLDPTRQETGSKAERG